MESVLMKFLYTFRRNKLGNYNRENETSNFSKRNEQNFSFFASFFLLPFHTHKLKLNAD